MNLEELLQDSECLVGVLPTECKLTGITNNSRSVEPGFLFVALKGVEVDGHKFIDDAVKRGAAAIICETVPETIQKPDIPIVSFSDTSSIFPGLVKRFYNDPASQMSLFGITGTNGKTTVAYLISHLLEQADGQSSLMVGTVEVRLAGKRIADSLNTTPGILELTRFMDQARQANIHTGILEVSSHALDQGRVLGFEFDVAIFMNLTQDHLDYHQSFDEYYEAKKLLFTQNKSKVKIINQDDVYGRRLIQELRDEGEEVVSFSLRETADSWADNIKSDLGGVSFDWHYGNQTYPVTSSLFCRHNISNLIAALTAVVSAGINPEKAIGALTGFSGVPGRLERVPTEGTEAAVFVDYAHTPDAVLNVCQSVRQIHPREEGALLTVFGCGGDRDRKKRPLMAVAAHDYSDKVYVTSDNPRMEDPEQILDDITAVLTNSYERIADRAEAIRQALKDAGPNDVVLILGKGHEEYQIIGNEKHPFSDQEVVKKYKSGSTSKAEVK
jgi:UDP-N-acetylmuramoyl-L-alanyl-D-glutamate--2,6-diaminopimelate ligase